MEKAYRRYRDCMMREDEIGQQLFPHTTYTDSMPLNETSHKQIGTQARVDLHHRNNHLLLRRAINTNPQGCQSDRVVNRFTSYSRNALHHHHVAIPATSKKRWTHKVVDAQRQTFSLVSNSTLRHWQHPFDPEPQHAVALRA